MNKKFSAERSREIRQWIQLIGTMGTALLSLYLSSKFERDVQVKAEDIREQMKQNMNNSNRRLSTIGKDFSRVYNEYNQQKIQEEIIEAKHQKETELNRATMNGEKIIKFTKLQWKERYSRYSLLQQTYGVDGYYMPDYGEGRVYIYIIES